MSGTPRVIPGGPDGPDPGEADSSDISMFVLGWAEYPCSTASPWQGGSSRSLSPQAPWGPGNVQDWMIQATSPPKSCPVIGISVRPQDPHRHSLLMLQPHEPFQSRLCYLLPLQGTYHLIIKEKAYFFSMVICGNEACRKPHKIDGGFHEWSWKLG